MPRKTLLSMVVAAMSSGCMSQPLSDVSKAVPDEKLLGTWVTRPAELGGLLGDRPRRMVIDVPAVQGNPKGLMRIQDTSVPGTAAEWVYPTAVGDQAYLNYIHNHADFSRPDEFTAWSRGKKGMYSVCHYRVRGDTLVLNFGDHDALARLMKREGFDRASAEYPGPSYFPPAGWLAEYLSKNGPGGLFPPEMALTLDRVK